LGRFGRKTEGWRGNKSTLFCTFSRFGGFFSLQVIVPHNLPKNGPLPKKSRRKTYRRFSVFRELLHHRTMINENATVLHYAAGRHETVPKKATPPPVKTGVTEV
jgi:hypothetical protein